MDQAGIPIKFTAVFANAAANITSPIPTTYTGVKGSMSFTSGIPAECIQPIGGGGFQAFGADFNGIFNQTSTQAQWQAAGGGFLFDGTFASAVGGYPTNALVVSNLFPGNYWISLLDNNSNNPDTTLDITKWLPLPGVIDSPYSFGVGGTGVFSSLTQAFTFLSAFKITENGYVTLNVAAGKFTYTSPIVIDHPNADHIAINGAGYSGGTGVSFLASTGAASLTGLRSVYSTELAFNGSGTSWFKVLSPGAVISNLLLTQTGQNTTNQELAILDVHSQVFANNLSVCMGSVGGGNMSGIVVHGGGAICVGGLLSANWMGYNGIVCEFGGAVSTQPNPNPQNVATNIAAWNNSSNGIYLNNKGSMAEAAFVSVNFNTVSGIFVNNSSAFNTLLGNFNSNGSAGATFANNSVGVFGTLFGASSNFNSNGAGAILCTEGSVVRLTSEFGMSYSGNTGTNLVAQSGSFIDNSLGGPATSSSPGSNTIGNNNSYVKQ